MAIEPALPLDQIDPNACLHDAKAIDLLIPHRGPIRQVDRIVFAETPMRIAGVKEVRDDEFWCDGHIPGRPVMPGVLQLEAGAQLASILDTLCHGPDRFMGLVRIDDASFRGSVEPGDQLLLLGRRLKPAHKRRFVCQCQGLVRGNIVFNAQITGFTL